MRLVLKRERSYRPVVINLDPPHRRIPHVQCSSCVCVWFHTAWWYNNMVQRAAIVYSVALQPARYLFHISFCFLATTTEAKPQNLQQEYQWEMRRVTDTIRHIVYWKILYYKISTLSHLNYLFYLYLSRFIHGKCHLQHFNEWHSVHIMLFKRSYAIVMCY